MFLEKESEFRGEIVGLTDPLKLPQLAASLLQEFNLMHGDAQDARIDRAALWTQYVDFEHIRALAEAYRPAEAKLRELIGNVRKAKGDMKALESLRDEMADVLTRMETAVRPGNALLLREMSAKLWKTVERQEKGDPG